MSNTESNATDKRDVYARVTDQITAIEDGAVAHVAEIIRAAVGRVSDLAPSPSMERVREYIRASKAVNTLRGYQSDWRSFCAWCEQHSQCPLPALPERVVAYIAECAATLKVGSIQRRLNAIAEAHKAVNLESPSHLFWFELSLPVVSQQFRLSMTILAASAAFRRGLAVSAADSLGEEVAGAGVVGSNRPTVSVAAVRLPRCSTALRALYNAEIA